jgi:hypothetical protein
MMAGGLLILVVSFASLALVGCPSGGVGDPCIPEDEYLENFAGFKLTEENVESRSFQCQTRICLVNHFQGRVSCPTGQGERTQCRQDSECDTGAGEKCTAAGVLIKDCDPTPCNEEGADPNNCNGDGGANPACFGRVCDQEGNFCRCQGDNDCPETLGYRCCQDDSCGERRNLCTIDICSIPGDDNRCYVPGTDIPIAVPVCAQCAKESVRDADPESPDAVYCSCRCGPPEENPSPADENFNFCDCPEGFVCEEIRKNVGLGDAQLAGKYCVRQDTTFIDEARANCGTVQGYWGPQCSGTAP